MTRRRNIIILGVAFFLLIGLFSPFSKVFIYGASCDDKSECSDEINATSKKIKKYEAVLATQQSQYNSATSQVNKTKNLLQNTVSQIQSKEQEIARLSEQLENSKKILATYLRQAYYLQDEQGIVLVSSEKSDFQNFIQGNDYVEGLKEKIVATMTEIKTTEEDLSNNKESLAQERAKHEKNLSVQKAQQQDIYQDVQETQMTISELNDDLAELQSDYSDILGTSVSIDDIKDAVSFASRKTGVRKGFLYAILYAESKLGKSTGSCTYEKVEDGAYARYKSGKLRKSSWLVFLNRKAIFQDICDDLGYNYKKQKVSCNPASYAGTGGAMGIPQFMPDTWKKYAPSISNLTGHDTPNPWRVDDGVVAAALYLKNAGGASKSGECTAAKRYIGASVAYAANNCKTLLYWANNYESLLK